MSERVINGLTYTGVLATPEEVEQLKRPVPYVVIGGVAPELPQKACHRMALGHGLPEIPGYYGCDLRTGEFVRS